MSTRLSSRYILLSVTLVLTACGNGSGSSSQATPSTSDTINGIQVPPDPGAAANATIVGVDVNANGLRDEVERSIATKYGSSANQYQAAVVSAKAYQTLLITDQTNINAVNDALQASSKAAGCSMQKLSNDAATASHIASEAYLLTYNTPERIGKRKAVVSASSPMSGNADSSVDLCQ